MSKYVSTRIINHKMCRSETAHKAYVRKQAKLRRELRKRKCPKELISLLDDMGLDEAAVYGSNGNAAWLLERKTMLLGKIIDHFSSR